MRLAMHRRGFLGVLAAAAMGGAAATRLARADATMHTPLTRMFPRHDWVPNNPRLPVLLYRRALAPQGADPAAALEALFDRNDWPPARRYTVYPFHHYRSIAHEVLGFARGHAA
ncbi:MAG: hypothetical protein QM601_09625 [Pseudoxanthomonas sp.]